MYTTETDGAAIHALNVDIFQIINSNFTNFHYARYGGAIYLSKNNARINVSAEDFMIMQCIFSNNSAIQGGAIYLDYVDSVDILLSTFIQNSAISNDDGDGNGGAIYYASSGNEIFYSSFLINETYNLAFEYDI